MTADNETTPEQPIYSYGPRAPGEGDPSAEANARVVAEIAARCNRPIPYDQLVTKPSINYVRPR
jgi:hypothetical protein